MNADILVNRYRTFLLLVAGFSCVFTIVELWLEEHTGDPPQLIPFFSVVLARRRLLPRSSARGALP